eukprot:1113126-Rhodomonas_salina.2
MQSPHALSAAPSQLLRLVLGQLSQVASPPTPIPPAHLPLAFGAHDVGLPDQVTLTLARSVFVMRCLRLRCALLLPERDGRTSCCGRVGSRDACARPRPLHCRIKHADLQSPSTLDLDCSSVYVLSQCADMGCGTCREWVLDDAFHLVARTPLRL